MERQTASPGHPVPPALLAEIAEAIRGIRFGCVQITIHDSQVVQIERAEKIRIQQAADLTPGGAESSLMWRADRMTGGSLSSGDR